MANIDSDTGTGMVRTNYIVIARAFNASKPVNLYDTESRIRHSQWAIDVQATADALKADNPHFNMYLFINACKGN